MKLTNNDMIYYSHVNEISEPEREALLAFQADELHVVAGSGERVLALLDNFNGRVFIVDSNESALKITALKLAALRSLGPSAYLEFMNLAKTSKRKEMSDSISGFAYKRYWRERLDHLETSIFMCGHFEKFVSRVSKLNRLMWGKKIDKALCGDYHGFNHRKMEFMLSFFNSPLIFRLFGNSDSAFVSKGADQKVITGAILASLKDKTFHHNIFNHLIFKGNLSLMTKDDLPCSLNEVHLQKIKKDLDVIEVNHDVLSHVATLSFSTAKTFFSLSDILSFVDQEYFLRLIGKIKELRPNHVIVYRTFLKNRDLTISGAVEMTKLETTGMYRVWKLSS